ncbi:MAG: hypothetical protein CMJ33_10790 [Phycisphaerae bacterium]|nr:hypothetical protein [Phycisphaerae bacterium]
MHIVRSRFPLFFYRRLVLVVGIGVFAALLLGLRLVQLTVVEGEALRQAAERSIRRDQFLPTWRGSITDRNGLVLAEDRASWDLGLPFTVLSGRWANERATEQAMDSMGRDAWGMLSPEVQGELILERVPSWNALVEQLYEGICAHTGLERQELDRRIDGIRQSISRMIAHVHDRQRSAFEAIQDSTTLDVFRPRPIAEELESHVLVSGLDDEVVFRLRRFTQALQEEADSRLDGGGSGDLELVEFFDSGRRSRPFGGSLVTIDRSSFPRALRSDEPLELLVTGIGDHILGTTRTDVRAEDVKRRPFRDASTGSVLDLGGYRPGLDSIGVRGVEASMEDRLRGTRGIESRNLETNEVTRQAHVPGEDIRLTIDWKLQAEIQALLDPRTGLARVQQYHVGWTDGAPNPTRLPLGTPLDGSVVVLDVETGEILAMVSSPTFTEGLAMDRGDRTTHAPFLHRAVEATCPPGSIVKPLVYVAAATDGVIAVDERIECTGHFLPNKTDRLRCWIYKSYGATHGSPDEPLDATAAIQNSCNIFFYEIGQRMGLERLAGWYRRWGLDDPLRTGLAYEREIEVTRDGVTGWETRSFGESGGMVPDPSTVPAGGRGGESIMLGIGQGRLTWTPLQAANAYAMLARGGGISDAYLIAEDWFDDGRRSGSLNLDPEACRRALEGLRLTIEDSQGTGNNLRYPDGRDPIFDISGVRVWGKTGTATAPARRVDVNGDGILSDAPPDERKMGLDHAWFVGLAGDRVDDRPRYAVAVLLEYGGSGGRVSGPLAAEVIRALVRHGYLQGDSFDDMSTGGAS